jgi:uncharacterized membrane protein YfcA
MTFEFLETLLYTTAGAAGGFLAGLLGVGGGIIFIPVFQYIFTQKGIDGEELVRFTLANSFLSILFSGITSSRKHYKKGNFHIRPILSIALPAIITSSLLSFLITDIDFYTDRIFRIVFLIMLGYTLIKQFRNSASSTGTPTMWRYLTIGLITGATSAISGLGGGVVMIPLLLHWAGYDMKKASAVSIGVISILVIPMLVVYGLQSPQDLGKLEWTLGYLSMSITPFVVLGVFIGAPLGIKTAQKAKNSTLKAIFGALIALLMVKYIWQIIQE